MTYDTGAGTTTAFNNGNAPSFSDLIDIINPLQHIPVVNTIYRAITGDHEGAMADVLGGTLYGGPVGAVTAMADLGLRDTTGGTVGEHVTAMLGFGKGGQPASATAIASAQPAPAQASAAQTSAVKTAVVLQALTATSAPATVTLKPASLASATKMLAPLPSTATDSGAATNAGPAAEGDYLVFGSGAHASPAGTPITTSDNATGAKTFVALGANTEPATTLPPVQVAATTAPAMAGSVPQHMFRVPPRTGPATPSAVLPPPTTGPGALPGGKSMALSAQDLAVQQDPQHNFLSAYTQALDRYRNAQRLAAGQVSVTPLAGGPSSSGLMQPAAAVAPAPATDDEGSAVTVH